MHDPEPQAKAPRQGGGGYHCCRATAEYPCVCTHIGKIFFIDVSCKRWYAPASAPGLASMRNSLRRGGPRGGHKRPRKQIAKVKGGPRILLERGPRRVRGWGPGRGVQGGSGCRGGVLVLFGVVAWWNPPLGWKAEANTDVYVYIHIYINIYLYVYIYIYTFFFYTSARVCGDWTMLCGVVVLWLNAGVLVSPLPSAIVRIVRPPLIPQIEF